MAEECPRCGGSGMETVERPGGVTAVRECACQVAVKAERRWRRAGVPKRYEKCALENFDLYPSADRTLEAARLTAAKFVEGFPLETDGRGLLITGSIGVGKTHLAVGILRALVQERGAQGMFCDYRDLLKQVQNSYNKQVAATELEVLAPVMEAEVLVLDELGASKPSEWVWDTVAQILNTRYNERRTTIITTNFANLPPLGAGDGGALASARASAREETLGDRIGERMRSRLQEMCVVVEMLGRDFRQSVKRASFG